MMMDEQITNASEPYWTACYTSPQAERRVQKGIEDLGFGTFLPSFRRCWYDHRGELRARSLPMLAGYVLVAINHHDDNWTRINSDLPEQCGRARVLTNVGEPIRIKGADVTRLMLAHATGQHNVLVPHRAANGQFTSADRRRQKKRRRRPRHGKRLRKPGSFPDSFAQPFHGIAVA